MMAIRSHRRVPRKRFDAARCASMKMTRLLALLKIIVSEGGTLVIRREDRTSPISRQALSHNLTLCAQTIGLGEDMKVSENCLSLTQLG